MSGQQETVTYIRELHDKDESWRGKTTHCITEPDTLHVNIVGNIKTISVTHGDATYRLDGDKVRDRIMELLSGCEKEEE